MVAWPQWAQRNHSRSALVFITLKLLPSTQHGHRMASGILVSVTCRMINHGENVIRRESYYEARPLASY
jgi:hypothetical protein